MPWEEAREHERDPAVRLLMRYLFPEDDELTGDDEYDNTRFAATKAAIVLRRLGLFLNRVKNIKG